MVSTRSAGNQREELESFKQALLEEYGRKLEVLKDRFDQEFSALIAARRIEVETKVQRIRESLATEFETEIAAARQSAFMALRVRVLNTINETTNHLDEIIRDDISSLRKNPDTYKAVLNDLALEALDALGEGNAVLCVAVGESHLIEEDPRVVRIEENPNILMGGVLAKDAETGTHLLDNSLGTRWERLKPFMVETLSGQLASLVNDAQEPLAELRLP